MVWKFKLALKIISGRFPAVKRAIKRLGYFRHGRMESPEYATGVFARHFREFLNGSDEPGLRPETALKRGTCLEIGPGESLLTVMLARVAGFERVILVDEGRQIRENAGLYREFSRRLRDQGHDVPLIAPDWGTADILRAYGGEYLTGGLGSLAGLPDGSIDFSFSHAVLEHLPRGQVPDWLRELRRVSRVPSRSSHVVDLRDHLGGSINHLRFADSFWEGAALRRSGVYTNRLRYSQWMRLFEDAGWKARIVERQAYTAPPLNRNKLAPAFRELGDGDLSTHGFQVTLEE
jgi:hypothetical protein